MTPVISDRRTSKCCMHFPAFWRFVLSAALCCCLAPMCAAQRNETNQPATPDAGQNGAAPIVVTEMPEDVASKPDKKQLREAEAAYLSGANKLDRDELDGAERDFVRA